MSDIGDSMQQSQKSLFNTDFLHSKNCHPLFQGGSTPKSLFSKQKSKLKPSTKKSKSDCKVNMLTCGSNWKEIDL